MSGGEKNWKWKSASSSCVTSFSSLSNEKGNDYDVSERQSPKSWNDS